MDIHISAKQILILGDGNMSFALALENLIRSKSSIAFEYLGEKDESVDCEITATTFDSEVQLLEKYQECKDILPLIRSKRLHEINAWELASYFEPDQFDVIIWNHPHLGTEDFRLHRFLMAHFFKSCTNVLKKSGKVCISLVKGQHLRWDLVNQAAKSSCLNVTAMIPFLETDWPGYTAKRNKHGRSFKNTQTMIHHAHEMSSLLFRFSFDRADQAILDTLEQEHIEMQDLPNNAQRKLMGKIEFTKHTCQICSRSLASERGLKNHVHTVHVLKAFGQDWTHDGPKIHPCPNCNKMFKTTDSAWQHTVNMHSTFDPSELGLSNHNEDGNIVCDYYPCGVCGQAVESRGKGMELHLETLKPAVGLKMKCVLCGNDSFIESRALFQHYKFCKIKNCE